MTHDVNSYLLNLTPIDLVLIEMFTYIFDGLNERFSNELEAVRAQHPFKDLRYARPPLRLTFQEGIQLLQDAGYDGTHQSLCMMRSFFVL